MLLAERKGALPLRPRQGNKSPWNPFFFFYKKTKGSPEGLAPLVGSKGQRPLAVQEPAAGFLVGSEEFSDSVSISSSTNCSRISSNLFSGLNKQKR